MENINIKNNLSIIDYGCGNLKSLINIFYKLKVNPKIAETDKDIRKDDILILPGVGSWDFAIYNLRKKKLYDAIKNHIENERKILGICLGMQLLCKNSMESKCNDTGFNIFNGNVVSFKEDLCNVGWRLNIQETNKFKININEKYFYFNHKFYCKVDENVLSCTYINDTYIPTIVKKNNVYGVQFHPEKKSIKWY